MKEDPNKITYIAMTNSRGTETPFGIKRRDRERHMYIIGKTGMGKSTLLENMAIQDIRNGEGLAFIDPHGGTADRILEYVPEHRIKDVIYFAPFDMDYPIAFNVMEDVGYDKRHLVVSGLLSAFRKIWVDAWSARMEYILSNTLLALLEYDGATLLDVNRMLINKAFRKKVVDNVKDPIVKDFWVGEFANYTDRYTQDATPAIQNKIGQFTSNPLIRNIVGQPKSSFDIRKAMDERKILIMNLSKGRVGEVNATLLGSMLTTKIYLAAMSRADVPAATLKALPNFYFYVDEFQNFANESFSDILSEARKYKLNLIIAHQYIEQMEEDVRNAVFGNVGTTVAFRVGPFDAEVLETVFSPVFMATDLVNLGFAQIYLTLMIDGVGSPPFSATTLPPFDPPPQSFIERSLQSSRDLYAKPRAEIENNIVEWQGSDPLVVEPPKPKYGAPKKAPVPQRTSAAEVASSFSKPAPVATPAPRGVGDNEARHAEAKHIGQQISKEHAVAMSQAQEESEAAPQISRPRSAESPRPQSRPPEQRPRPQPAAPRPDLEGAKSLREALAKVTRSHSSGEAGTPAPQKQVHAPDLKNTLNTVAPRATESVKAQEKESEILHQPPELPEAVLRSMLAVDDFDDEMP